MATLVRTKRQLQIHRNSSRRQSEIQIVLHPPSVYEPAESFEDHTSQIVEIVNSNVKLPRAATLFLPHCLKLKTIANSGVRIFRSHHTKGDKPVWEDVTNLVTFTLSDFCCEIKVILGGWYKYTIRSFQVDGKWLMVYAKGEISKGNADIVTVCVGYHPYYSREANSDKLEDNVHGESRPFLFFKEPRADLHISLVETKPLWKLISETANPIRIPYSCIELSQQKGYKFTFQHLQPKSTLPRCAFEISGHTLQRKCRLTVNFRTLQSPVKNEAIVTDDALILISHRLEDNWKEIGRLLQVPERELHKITQYGSSVQEKGYRMLMAWKNRVGKDAVIEKLRSVLHDASKPDLADTLPSGCKQSYNGSVEEQSSMAHSEDTHLGTISSEDAILMMSSSVISSEGGVISIYGTGVELHVPPGALQDENLIQLKILPHHENDTPAKCFEDHSTVMVEVFPNKLTLLQPASLFLPHCLKIKSVKECDVRVFQSHHTQDQEPLWEDVTWRVQYLLSDIRCEIKIQEFCWIKYSIKGAQVEAKRLLLYAVGKKCKEDSKCVTVHVGYCLDLPHENKLYREKLRRGFLGDEQKFLFRKEPPNDLIVSFKETLPVWKLWTACESLTKISYENIEASIEQSRPFVFQQGESTSNLPHCMFKIFQEAGKDSSTLLIDFTNQTPDTHCSEDRVVKTSALDNLSSLISNDWLDIGRKLDIPDPRLNCILGRQILLKEKCYQMLVVWKQREGRHAKLDKLQKALRDCSRKDLADMLSTGENEEEFISKIMQENFSETSTFSA